MARWTIKQLKEISDIDFAIMELQERKNKLSNPYSPLAEKISKVIATLEKLEYGKRIDII